MRTKVEIGGRNIGSGHPVYIVAEMSANHQRSFDAAVEIIKAARKAGADAIKLQTYTADTLTIDCDNEYFRINGTLWEGKTLYDLYREAYTPWEWQPKLKSIAESLGLDLISTPFDFTSVDFLEKMGLPAYKVASFELVDLPLLRKIARTKKPIIMSTGMATLSEIEQAINTVGEEGIDQIVLLKCTSAYPALPEEMNLRAMLRMSERFGVPVGLSDHTLGIAVPIAAVALGASLIEKHLTLSRSIPGPDAAFSLEPQEFSQMVDSIRTAERALGEPSRGVIAGEEKSRIFRRSLFVVRKMVKGEVFSEENVRSIRPAHGLAPRYLPDILGRRAARDIDRGTPLDWAMVV